MIKKNLKKLILKFNEFFQIYRWDVLIDIINENQLETYCEIGVYKADIAKHLLKNCKSLKKIYLIDKWDPSVYNYKNFKDHKSLIKKQDFNQIYLDLEKKYKKNKKIEIIRNDSINASKMFENKSLDIIFIDADHSYKGVKKDIEIWLKKIKENGYLTGHDYSLKYFGVVKAVNEKLNEDNIRLESDSVWVYKKR